MLLFYQRKIRIGTYDGTAIIPLRIRKITSREAMRLMGLKDIQIDRIKEFLPSKSAQYKLAGNSIVVNVLQDIFKNIKWEK